MLRRTVIIGVFLLSLVSVSMAQEWDVDLAHSSIGFSVKHLVISKVNGKFSDFAGKIKFDGKDLSIGSAELTIQSKSINTDNTMRDNHLRNSDFFAVDSFPTITFKSKKVIPADGNNFKLVGDMTMRGVTKEVTFDCTFNGTINAMGTERASFSAKTSINRQDFKVSWSKALDGGGLVVSDNVDINIEIEAIKAK